MNIEGASTLVHEEAPPSVNSSATTTIQSIKNLKYNQKTILAAVIQTSKETVSVPTIDEETGIDLLLKENEHVYLFSIELKKNNKAEMQLELHFRFMFNKVYFYGFELNPYSVTTIAHPLLLFFSSLLQFLKTLAALDYYSFFCKPLTFLPQN